ncbi:MAG: aldo/keto reductase, partial [Limnochordia bacterium]|nr:aldo/keto reductase [Limnochordia bacterium]
MQKIVLGAKVASAPIALGCMRLAGLNLAAAEQLVHTALEEEIDLFDHADIYGQGQSEVIFGQVLKRNPSLRDKLLIQDKCSIRQGYYDASAEHITAAVDQSLKRLGVESIDILLLHRPDALIEPEEVAGAFDALEQAGKVKYFGVSNYNAAQIQFLQAFVKQKLMINQLQFSLAHTALIDSGINVNMQSDYALDRTGHTLEYCRLHNLTIQAWSPFQHGMFEGVFLTSEKYEALNKQIRILADQKGVTDGAIAVAWIMRHPARIQTIVGTTNVQRLRDICKAPRVHL